MAVSSAQSGRKDRKRAEIVAVAKQLFFEEGYAGTSMAQIAARVGGSKATLYNHFTSKEELLLAVVKDITAPRVSAVLDQPAPSRFPEWLYWMGSVAIRMINAPELVSMQRLAVAEALRFPEIARIIYEEGIRPGHEQLALRFQQAIDEGELRPGDPLQMTEDFIDLCLGWRSRRVLWNLESPPDDAEIAARVRRCVTAFIEGFGVRKA